MMKNKKKKNLLMIFACGLIHLNTKESGRMKKSKCGDRDMKKQNIPEERSPKTGQLEENLPTR